MPDTVYHLVVEVDPVKDSSWGSAPLTTYPTDEVHAQEIRQGQIQVRARLRTLCLLFPGIGFRVQGAGFRLAYSLALLFPPPGLSVCPSNCVGSRQIRTC